MSNPFVFVTHDFSPEPSAMLQALYSRDPRSVLEHIKRVEEIGSDKFMGSFYVGYGHKSIGDCGTTTIFIEQVSMLAAKAFQDWPLYNGQEASTRYLDMSKQDVRNPLATTEGQKIQEDWMSLYTYIQQGLIPYLQGLFPRSPDQSERIYEKAIYAKSFDIARGFLPAGTTTLLAWHTNLRQAYDHLQQLHYHPLAEIREVTDMVHNELKQKYSNSFSHKFYEASENYIKESVLETAYLHDVTISDFSMENLLDMKGLQKYTNLLESRPEKTELVPFFRKFGNVKFQFLLDFGSYRDLQRHRSGVIPMPLLTLDKGFHPWYLDSLPADMLVEVKDRMNAIADRVAKLDCSPEDRQYYTPMGYQCTIEATVSLPAALYIAEIRSAQTVHPTLRVVAQQMGEALKKAIPGLAVHIDLNADEWSIKRGTHDIVKKEIV